MKTEKAKLSQLVSLICGECNRWQKFVSKNEIAAIRYQQYQEALNYNREDIEQLELWW